MLLVQKEIKHYVCYIQVACQNQGKVKSLYKKRINGFFLQYKRNKKIFCKCHIALLLVIYQAALLYYQFCFGLMLPYIYILMFNNIGGKFTFFIFL